ncbi:hypothetical protein KI387_008278 [Taxus chinensis]|uniref:Uncharacterized protein n=1 Tax=Taxus chinensis TaxID=29808 RepID=A0AA38CX62_TAXCH|nr:hypothetical protein KI387_008278 [Taxus chinensis]
MASGNEIKVLADNPKSFLEVNRLGYSISQDFNGEAFVKLVRASSTENFFNLEKASESKKSISKKAYLLEDKLNEKNDAFFLDISSKGMEEGKLLFTYKLTGCSLVVTRGKIADSYQVYHDNRRNSAVLYKNVVMSLDYDEYKVFGLFPEGTAVACMQFRNGAWKLYVQQQYLVKDPANAPPKDSKNVMQLRVVEKDIVKDKYMDASLQKSFDEKRKWMQQRIKDLAKTLGISSDVIDNAKDGVYKGKGEFNENDPSINEWNKLRDAIEEKLVEKNKNEAEAVELKKDDIARWKTNLMKIASEIANYKGMMHASNGLDKIWLWLQIKKVTSLNANQ